MIKFFRNIRKKLLSEGKTSRYFTYAIGEIILVVIGILIALQVNNWNENRKRRNLEVKIYKELHRDLSQTLSEVEVDRNNHINLLQCVDSLMQHIVNKQPYHQKVVQQLICSVGDLQVYPKTSGFDALKSIGLDLLSNDSIRSSLTDLYQLQLERVVKKGKEYTQVNNLQSIMDPYLDYYLIANPNQPRIAETRIGKDSIINITQYGTVVRHYEEFLEDTKLLSQLNRVQFIRRDKIRSHTWVQIDIKKMMAAIEQELERIDPQYD